MEINKIPLKIVIQVKGNVSGGETTVVPEKTTRDEIALAIAELKVREKGLVESFESKGVSYSRPDEL